MEDVPARSRTGVVIAGVLTAAVALVGLLVWGINRRQEQRELAERTASEQLRSGVPSVAASPVRKVAALRRTVELAATLRSASAVTVLPEIPGKLAAVRVGRGDRVSEGEVLAVVETDTLEAHVEQAKAALGVATAASKQAQVGRDNAAREHDRIERLVLSKSVPNREADTAKAAFDAAEAQLELALSQVEQARAALRLAELQLEKATIRAPFAGVVADDYNLTVGQMIGPQVPVARLVDMEDLRATARAAERELPRLHPGQKVEVRVAAHGRRPFPGKVLAAGPAVDPVSRTAVVEIAVENVVEEGDYLLKPGMFAEASVTIEERADVLAVRRESVVLREGRETVLVARPAEGTPAGLSRLESRPVTTGLRSGEWVQIASGIEEGELVVTSSPGLLEPGAEVRLEGSAAAGASSEAEAGAGRGAEAGR
jgi:RND family efflux transporter MFP subunit